MQALQSPSSASEIEYFEEVKDFATEDFLEGYVRRHMDPSKIESPEEFIRPYALRLPLVRKYAWAIPNDAALSVIAKYGPVVEIGAGTGYWAHLLQQKGVDVKPYDKYPPNGTKRNHYHPDIKTWTRVYLGGPEKAKLHAHRSLMLCWPPYDRPMAGVCLDNYKGNVVIYIGEWHGCTADAGFHKTLSKKFEEIECVKIPQWPGLHDYLTVWKRKRRSRNARNAT